MSAQAPNLALARSGLVQGRALLGRAGAAAEHLPVPAVLGGFVVIEWAAVLALARTVRHSGWIYYQGGDQLWSYTLGWLLAHGELGPASVGYGWSAMLAPIARIAGPNLVSALPAIVLLNVLVLLPVAMLALYGIAARIGGRLFGYWAVAVWIAVPFVGILYTDAGYHQKYTELLLPQAFGLTGLADFPTTVAALVSIYFCARIVFTDKPLLIDAVAAGAAAGIAVTIKPSTALFLVGPALAFLYKRRLSSLALFVAGMAPALIALGVWKERGLGRVPIVNGMPAHGGREGVAAAAPVFGIDPGRYFNGLNWNHFASNVDQLREHFWSGRLLQWFLIAGVIGLTRRSRPALLLIGAPIAAFVVVKGSYTSAGVEDGSVFRIMMPVFPLFVLTLACLPLLLPHAPRHLTAWRPAFRAFSPRLRGGLVLGVILLSAIVPLAAFAAADTRGGAVDSASVQDGAMPVPANVDLKLTVRRSGSDVDLRWRAKKSIGGPVIYSVWRGPASGGNGFTCDRTRPGARWCIVNLPQIRLTRGDNLTDHPGPGRWIYRVAIIANWLDDPQYGDVYVVGAPVHVTVP